MRRGFAAILFSQALLLLGAGVAHADPDFDVTEAAVGRGDVVHFSISDTKKGSSYELEVAGQQVAKGGIPRGDRVSDAFTMVDVGDVSTTVTVVAKIRERKDVTTRSRELQYVALGAPVSPPADIQEVVPVAAPASPLPSILPAQPTQPLDTVHALPAAAPSTSRPTATPRQAQPARLHAGGHGRRVHARRSLGAGRSSGGSRHSPPARARGKRPPPRTAPLFDGVPESSSGPRSSHREQGFLSLNAIAPPAGTPAGSAGDADEGGALMAVLVPAALALAAMLLAGTALVRTRLRLRTSA